MLFFIAGFLLCKNILCINILQVRAKEADQLFSEGKFVESAKLYINTKLPFEQIFFKLNSIDDDRGLHVYLKEKLLSLEEKEVNQRTVITIVLLEYYFSKLGEAKDDIEAEKENR